MPLGMRIVWAVASTAGVISLLFWVYQITAHPLRAWNAMHVGRDRGSLEKTLIYGNMALRFLTVWLVLYHGLHAVFGWIPESWGSETEDGYMTARDWVSGMLSLVATVIIVSTAASIALLKAKEAQKD